jgi:iron complex transport system permease protein
MKSLTLKKYLSINAILLVVLIIVCFVALNIGPERATLFSKISTTNWNIMIMTRLPRIILGVLVGITLASSGTAFQSLLRNPLADPYILGVSGGAALGSVIGVALGLPFTLIGIVAFVSAFLTMLLIYWIAETKGRLPAHTLLLTGVIFNAFAFALIMLIHSLVSMEQAHEILFLLMGNLELYSYKAIAIVGVAVAIGFSLLIAFSGKMNLMSTGDDTAFHLGIDIERFRRIIFFSASLMIGAVVSVSGLIGFVGIFVPHTLRLILGPDHRLLIPASGLLGGAFLVIADTIARTALSSGGYQMQLPVGVITALIGGPFFVFVLKRQLK